MATMIWPTSVLTSLKIPCAFIFAAWYWAQRLVEGVLVAHGEDAAAPAVLDGCEDHVGLLVLALAEDLQLEEFGARPVGMEGHAQGVGQTVVVPSEGQSFFEELLGHFGLDEVLVLSRALAHGFRRGRAPGGG